MFTSARWRRRQSNLSGGLSHQSQSHTLGGRFPTARWSATQRSSRTTLNSPPRRKQGTRCSVRPGSPPMKAIAATAELEYSTHMSSTTAADIRKLFLSHLAEHRTGRHIPLSHTATPPMSHPQVPRCVKRATVAQAEFLRGGKNSRPRPKPTRGNVVLVGIDLARLRRVDVAGWSTRFCLVASTATAQWHARIHK